MKPRRKTKSPLGMTQAQHKRLETHQHLLDAVEAAERACIEAIAVAKTLDRLSADAAMAAQEAHWELSEARKRLAHNDMMAKASTKERNAGEDTQGFIDALAKSAGKASAAVDEMLEEVKASNRRIAKMERNAKRERQKR